MVGFICLFLPSVLAIFIHMKAYKKEEKILYLGVLYFVYALVINALVFGVLFVAKKFTGSLMEYISSYHRFALRYMFLSIFFVFLVSMTEYLFYNRKKFSVEVINCKIKEVNKVVFGIYSLVLLILQIINCFFNTFWLDEAVTINHCQKDIISILDWAGRDVHPPLYYIMLHGTYIIFGNLPIVYSMLSAFPFFLIVLFSGIIVSKEFGKSAAYLLVTFWGTMSTSVNNLAEVRMYSWAGLFVTLTLYFVYAILKDDRVKEWILFTTFVVFSSYTHYYALLHVAFMCLFLLVYAVLYKKSILKKIFISIGVCVLLYLPWIYKLISQVKDVCMGGFWLKSIPTVKDCVYQLFRSKASYFLFIIFVISVVLVICRERKGIFIRKIPSGKNVITLDVKKILVLGDSSKELIVLCGLLSIVGTFGVGLLFSHLIQPVFTQRYMFFGAVLAWFLFSLCFGEGSNLLRNILCIIVIVLLIGVNVPVVKNLIVSEKSSYYYTNSIIAIVDEPRFADNVIVVADKWSGIDSLIYYLPQKAIENENSRDIDEIKEDICGEMFIYFSSEDKGDEFKKNGIVHELISQGNFAGQYTTYLYAVY